MYFAIPCQLLLVDVAEKMGSGFANDFLVDGSIPNWTTFHSNGTIYKWRLDIAMGFPSQENPPKLATIFMRFDMKCVRSRELHSKRLCSPLPNISLSPSKMKWNTLI
jgi:hypothetical protein